MDVKEAELPLLSDEDVPPPRQQKSLALKVLCATICALLLSNVLTLILLVRQGTTVEKEVSKFAGLAYDSHVMFKDWTEFQDPETRNQSWHDLDLTPVKVLLSDAEAIELGLDVSLNRFPWDEAQGIYIVRAFHDLHCLKYIEYAYRQPDREKHDHHVYHCLDSLRQDLMCNADDTPMAVTAFPDKIGVDQVRSCRNFDALVEWTQLPNIFPCYNRMVDDPREPEKQIEAYGYCKEGSPYYAAQEAYFAKWGHIL